MSANKKLSVAHKGDFNRTNYTLKKRHYITPHSASVKQKEIPTYPTFFSGGMSQEPDILFYLALLKLNFMFLTVVFRINHPL